MGILNLPDFIPTGPEGYDPAWFDPTRSWLTGAQRPSFPPSLWSSFPPLPSTDNAPAPAAPAAASPAPAAPPSPQPPPNLSLPVPANPLAGIGDVLRNFRAGIPQALADNSNTLLAFGGGALRGGIGQGLGVAAGVGRQESELAQRRKALNAQQAATIAELRGAGLKNPEQVAAMHPAMARVLLTYLNPRS